MNIMDPSAIQPDDGKDVDFGDFEELANSIELELSGFNTDMVNADEADFQNVGMNMAPADEDVVMENVIPDSEGEHEILCTDQPELDAEALCNVQFDDPSSLHHQLQQRQPTSQSQQQQQQFTALDNSYGLQAQINAGFSDLLEMNLPFGDIEEANAEELRTEEVTPEVEEQLNQIHQQANAQYQLHQHIQQQLDSQCLTTSTPHNFESHDSTSGTNLIIDATPEILRQPSEQALMVPTTEEAVISEQTVESPSAAQDGSGSQQTTPTPQHMANTMLPQKRSLKFDGDEEEEEENAMEEEEEEDSGTEKESAQEQIAREQVTQVVVEVSSTTSTSETDPESEAEAQTFESTRESADAQETPALEAAAEVGEDSPSVSAEEADTQEADTLDATVTMEDARNDDTLSLTVTEETVTRESSAVADDTVTEGSVPIYEIAGQETAVVQQEEVMEEEESAEAEEDVEMGSQDADHEGTALGEAVGLSATDSAQLAPAVDVTMGDVTIDAVEQSVEPEGSISLEDSAVIAVSGETDPEVIIVDSAIRQPTPRRAVLERISPKENHSVRVVDSTQTEQRPKAEGVQPLFAEPAVQDSNTRSFSYPPRQLTPIPDLSHKDDTEVRKRYDDKIKLVPRPRGGPKPPIRKISPEVTVELQNFEESFRGLSDNYRLLDKVGEGTFSSVYLAEDIHYEFNKELAVHALPKRDNGSHWRSPPMSSKKRMRLQERSNTELHRGNLVAIKRIYVTSSPKRILNEIRILDALSGYDNISPLITAIRHEDQILAVLPYFEHQDFRTLYKTGSLSDIRIYTAQLCQALKYVHSKDIIHRDIKPTNFLYDRHRRYGVLVDFGLAEVEAFSTSNPCICTSAERRQKLGVAMHDLKAKGSYEKNDIRSGRRSNRAGTRGFRAPEVLFKCTCQTTQIDMWSVGVVLLSFLARALPFFMSHDDADALVELSAIFGRQEMRKCGLYHGAYFECSIPKMRSDAVDFGTLLRQTACPEEWLDPVTVDFLTKTMELDPRMRLTAEEALKHEFVTRAYECEDHVDV